MQPAPIQSPARRRIAIRLAVDWPTLLLPDGVLPQVAVDVQLARVPGCADWLRGVIARRGTMVPVFDVGRFFGAEGQRLDAARIVILDPDDRPLAVLCPELPQIVEERVAGGEPAAATVLPPPALAFLTSDPDASAGMPPVFDLRAWLRHAAPALSP